MHQTTHSFGEKTPYIDAFSNAPKPEEDRVLNLINKVQMFQIAVKRVNKTCYDNKQEPIFTMAKSSNGNAKGDFSKYFDE
jgi:hypothetical protein